MFCINLLGNLFAGQSFEGEREQEEWLEKQDHEGRFEGRGSNKKARLQSV